MPPLPTDGEQDPLLTVIIPVYNEAATVGEVLRQVLAAPYRKEVLVVEDGSTDGSAAALAGWADHPGVTVLRHPRNRGKGAAIRTALGLARGRFTLIQDADLEYDPADYARLLEPLLRGEAQVVYGSRYLRGAGRRAAARWCRWGVALLNFAVRVLYGRRLTDVATCYKALPTAVLRAMDLRSERFEFCPEVTAKACRLGLAIREVPIRYRPRSITAGKKIRWTDGVSALAALWKWREWSPPTGPGGLTPRRSPLSWQGATATSPGHEIRAGQAIVQPAAGVPKRVQEIAHQQQ